jgi:hypothetical protein
MSEKKFTTSEMRSHVRAPNRSMTWDDTCTNMIRWAADLIDAAEEVVKENADLRAENAAQALLIASLKGDCEAGKRLLREQMALTTARTGEALFVAQQLSDTQRQNAELCKALEQAKYAIKGREHTGFIDAAITACKANNEDKSD